MKVKRFISIICVLFMMFTVLFGCSDDTAATVSGDDYPVTVEGITLKAAPQKIGVLSDAHAMAMEALGKGNLLVGATGEYVKTHPNIVNLGYSASPDMDEIYLLSPDLIILPAEPNEGFIKGLTQRGIAYVVIPVPGSLDKLSSFYESMAKVLFGKTKYAEPSKKYITEVNNTISSLSKSNATSTKKAIVFTDENGFPITGDEFAGEAMRKAGIKNAGDGAKSGIMSMPAIEEENPDVIFCPKGTSENFLNSEALAETNAVKNGAVQEIDVAQLVYGGKDFAAILKDISAYLK